MDTTIFVGLDVHKKTIAVATAEGHASAEVKFYGTIANTPEAIRLAISLRKAGEALTLAEESHAMKFHWRSERVLKELPP